MRLLSNTIASFEFLPRPLAAFLAHHPAVDIDLEERPSVQFVAEGLADAGVVIDSADLAKLETFPFAMDRLVLITSRDDRLSRCRQVAFHEVLDAILVGRSLKLRVRLNGFDAICRMVEHGAGVAVIPETATRFRRKSAIKIVQLTDAWAVRKLVICVRRLGDLSEHARQLVEHLKAQYPASRSKPRRSTSGPGFSTRTVGGARPAPPRLTHLRHRNRFRTIQVYPQDFAGSTMADCHRGRQPPTR